MTPQKSRAIKRVLLYARVSTAEQAEKDLSIPAQFGALRRHCVERGYEIVREYTEAGASGTDDNRKAFRAMMAEALRGDAGIGAILVYQTSRFMRNVTKARLAKEALQRVGVRVISVCQEVDEGPMGQFMGGMFELVDEYESNVNGMRTSAAMRENARQGYFNGAVAPYGYRVEKIEIRPGARRGKLVIHPDEAATVREIFSMYLVEQGAKAVARTLNKRGVPYRAKQLWSKDKVLRIVGESAVIGTYFWGRRHTKNGTPADESEWIAIPVEPIVSQETFDTAQRVQSARSPLKVKGRTGSSPLLLAGLVLCGKCGASYQLETSGKVGPGGEAVYRYYNCRNFCRTGKESCAGWRVRTEVLDRAVLEHLAERIFTDSRCDLLIRDMVDESGVLRSKTDEQRQRLQNELDDVERRILKWTSAFESGEMPVDIGFDRVRELRARRDELRETLSKVVPLIQPPPALFTEGARRRFQRSLRELFFEESTLAKHYLRFLVEAITIRDGEVTLRARRAAVLQTIAAGGTPAPPASTTPEGVLTSGAQWLRLLDSNQRPGG